MSKIDWGKAGDRSFDPARVLRNQGDVDLVNTSTARNEAKQKAKSRSQAAKKATRTRRLNKEDEQAADRQAALREQWANDASEAFFAKIRARLAVRNEKRRAKISKPEEVGSLGLLLKRVLARD